MMRPTGLVLALLVALVMMPTRLMAQSLEELYQQAGAAESAGNYAEFETIIRKAIQLYPDEARSYFGLGIALDALGKKEEAIAAYRQAIKLQPDYALAYVNMGNALSDQKKLEEAIAAYRQAITLKPDYADAYNNLGLALYYQKKLEEAIAAYRQAIKLQPDYASAYNNMGIALDDLGKLEEAIAAYRQAIKLQPDYASAYYNMGNALRGQKKLEEAIAAYRQAIKLQPDYADAYYGLGIALYDQKKLEEAIAAYRQAIKLQPDYAFAYNGLGNVLRDQKKLEEAIAAYRQAIKLQPDYAFAYNGLGVVLYVQKKLEEAIAAFRQAIKLQPDYADAYNNLGHVLYGQKKLEEAIATFRQAIKLQPDYADAYNNLGHVLRQEKKLDEAIEQFERAIRLDPNLGDAYNGLGLVFKDQNKQKEAITYFRRALSLPNVSSVFMYLSNGEPSYLTTIYTIVYVNLGLLFQEEGKLAEAIEEFKKAVKTDPNFEYAQSNLQEAQRLLALKQQPAQLIALNETKYLAKDDPLTPIKRSIVKIKIVFPGNAKGASYGTGYVIKRQGNKVWIITNRHVVIDTDTQQEGTNLEIELYYGEKLPNIPRARSTAKIIKTTNNDNPDLALLETTALPDDIQPLTLRSSSPNPGAVTIIGHPNQGDWSEYKASFMSIKPSTGNLLIDVTLGKGASGSPILDSNLEVIGIMVRTVNESSTTSEAIGIGHPINLVIQQISQWGIKIP